MPQTHSFFQNISLETTARDAVQFAAAATDLPAGALINIAHIGRDSTEGRADAVNVLQAAGLTPRPIVSARRIASAAAADELIARLVRRFGLRRLFVVGGDPEEPAGPFDGALALIEGGYLDGLDLAAVGLPAYPEGHPVIPEADLDRHLHGKIRALAERGVNSDLTTQICLNPNAVADWLIRLRQQGFAQTVRIGIPGPADTATMLRFYRLCRVNAREAALAAHGWIDNQNPTRADPARFIQTLLTALAEADALANVHLHLFPMGSLNESFAWLNAQK